MSCCHGCCTDGLTKTTVSEEKMVTLMTPIDIPSRYSCMDYYVMMSVTLFIVPVMVVMCLSMILVAVPLLVVWVYRVCALQAPLDVVPRTCMFYVFAALVWVLSTPLLLLVVIWLFYVVTVILVLTLPIGICNWSRTKHSFKSIAPFLGVPGRPGAPDRSPADELATEYGCLWSFADIVCAVMGQLDRQGYLELLIGLSMMIGATPVYKWLLMANPFTHKLEEVYLSQWSDPLDANGDVEVDSQDQKIVQQTLRDVVCRSLLAERNRYIIDAWPFTGYHQYPPPGRRSRTMAGIQFSNTMSAPLFSHSTLPYDVPGHVPRSPSAAWGLLIVYIQWWNPFYPYTGYVELNVRKGGGLEHPMWLFNDRSSKLHMADLDAINRLFVKLFLNFAKYLRQQPAFQE